MSRLDRYRSLLLPLLAGIGTLSLVWAFIRISSEMVEGDTRGFDMLLLQWAHSMRAGHPWVVEVMRDFSGLGSTAVLVLFTAATAGYLALAGARTTALVVATAVITGCVFGAAWALVWLLLARRLARRPQPALETPTRPSGMH